jgi:hypothetical protein
MVVFGHERDEVIRLWSKLHAEEICNLHSLLNFMVLFSQGEIH